jgi:hypothetical protein
MLHPAPTTLFAYRLLGEVPFLSAEWPIRSSEINTEWVMRHPLPLSHNHSTVTLTDKEIKGG